MPAGDLIFQRLDQATDHELAAIARVLDETDKFTKQATKPEKIDLLSRELRSDAGSVFGNLGRHDHELAYPKILEDVVAKAASAAGWSTPKYPPETDALRLEDYVMKAFSFAITKENSTQDQSKQAEDGALRALLGKEPPAATGSSAAGTAARVAVIATQTLLRTNPLVVTASAVGALGLGIAWLAGPAMRRVTPAVLLLIQIRHRLEAEEKLRGAA